MIKNLRIQNGLTQNQVAELEPEYAETALDRKLYQVMIKLNTESKEKLLKIIDLRYSREKPLSKAVAGA